MAPKLHTNPNLSKHLKPLVWVINVIKELLKTSWRTTSGRIGLTIILIHIVLATVGHLFAPYSPTALNSNKAGDLISLSSPSWNFLLGTDQLGRDVLSRVMSGARSLILVSTCGTALGIALGSLVGMGSGYKGGRTDELFMRLMDGLMSFPSLLLALLILTTLASRPIDLPLIKPIWDELLIIFTIGFVNMPRVGRVMRSVTLSLKEMEFVQSARLRGEPTYYIIFREILPNTMTVVGVEASVRLSYAILLVSSLGFLGLGVQPPSPDWGLMIAQSRHYLVSAPWIALSPAAAVASLIIGVNLFTEGIRQARGLPQEDKP
jgi:peptide/nickel transport system permease protein